MLKIDGSAGEGGGQILRSSLALSLITGAPIQIENIRANRKKPGLMRQHLTCVKAATEVGDAVVDGDRIGSCELVFRPSSIRPGEYAFRIGTAGSTSLVLQTVLPALMLADTTSKVVLEGGTHNRAAPPADFLQRAFLPLLEKMGPRVTLKVESYGFFPAGGGRLEVTIEPCRNLKSLSLTDAGPMQHKRVQALVAHLPRHIGERECDTIRRRSHWNRTKYEVIEIDNSPGPGNVVLIEFNQLHVTEVFTGFGERGVTAERVARSTYREAANYLKADVPIGEHLADQLLLPMGIAASQGQQSTFRTTELSLHSTTHVEVLKQFLHINIAVDQSADGSVWVETGAGTTGR